jgi:hypothetical protein
MEDFPLSLKVLIWLVIGGTVAYVGGELIYHGLMTG